MSRDDYEDEDDRPRRKSKKKRRKSSGPNPLIWVVVGVLFLAVIVGGFFVVRGLTGNKPTDAKGNPIAAAGALPEAAKNGVKYVPRESEKKFEEYRKANPDKRLTEAEVFAIMGEPTRVDPPETVVRNGMRITFYEAYWEVPGSGISSSMTFANGFESGSVIGLEVTPRK